MTNITSKNYRKYKEKLKFVTIIFNIKMKAIVDSLEMKINKLISLYTVTKQEKAIIVNENANLKNELAEKQEVVKELEEKIKVIKISSLVSSNDEDKKKTKQNINEYVREIDRCIALLNK